jgi:hypothetical protein
MTVALAGCSRTCVRFATIVVSQGRPAHAATKVQVAAGLEAPLTCARYGARARLALNGRRGDERVRREMSLQGGAGVVLLFALPVGFGPAPAAPAAPEARPQGER